MIQRPRCDWLLAHMLSLSPPLSLSLSVSLSLCALLPPFQLDPTRCSAGAVETNGKVCCLSFAFPPPFVCLQLCACVHVLLPVFAIVATVALTLHTTMPICRSWSSTTRDTTSQRRWRCLLHCLLQTSHRNSGPQGSITATSFKRHFFTTSSSSRSRYVCVSLSLCVCVCASIQDKSKE